MPDYTQRPLSFKIKKALRYTRMYGVRRTLSIIQPSSSYPVKPSRLRRDAVATSRTRVTATAVTAPATRSGPREGMGREHRVCGAGKASDPATHP